MKINSVEKIINFDNGDSFKVDEKVKIKGFDNPEVVAVIDWISEVFSGQGSISFMDNKKEWFCIEVKDIEHIKHIMK